MARKRPRFVPVVELVERLRPDVDAGGAIERGEVSVDGVVIVNPGALVRGDGAVRVQSRPPLRGTVKLAHALARLGVDVTGAVAVDLGAAAGGFTVALLEAGAGRVYAVDAGFGQLRGRLRADPRVVNLEGTNLGDLDARLVPDTVEVVTADLSYLPVADAVPQLDRLDLAPAARLVALVKPTFELRAATVAAAPDDVVRALALAGEALQRHGWRVDGTCPAPRTGRAGSVEAFVAATRSAA